MPRSSLLIALPLFLLLLCISAISDAAAPDERAFPWISPFEEGVYVGDLLPPGSVEIDYETLRRHLDGKDVEAIILNAGANGFASVCIGFYDEKKRDVQPLWRSSQRNELPFTINSLAFDSIFIKYAYLPGDKYVSCNFKVAVGPASEREKPKMKVFRVTQDADYAGASLRSGDFILAGDSGGGGELSHLADNDYSDLVFVLRQKTEPPLPIRHTILAFSGCGLVGLTLWSFRRGKKGLTG